MLFLPEIFTEVFNLFTGLDRGRNMRQVVGEGVDMNVTRACGWRKCLFAMSILLARVVISFSTPIGACSPLYLAWGMEESSTASARANQKRAGPQYELRGRMRPLLAVITSGQTLLLPIPSACLRNEKSTCVKRVHG